jgi:hypothetical protein
LRKARDPVMGELTARDNARPLIPVEKLFQDYEANLNFTQFETMRKTVLESSFNETNQVVPHLSKREQFLSTLHDRKQKLKDEIEMLKRVADYKKTKIDDLPKTTLLIPPK